MKPKQKRARAVALASGASLLASLGLAGTMEKLATASSSSEVPATGTTVAARSRDAVTKPPSQIVIIRRKPSGTVTVTQPAIVQTVTAQAATAPAAPAPAAPAPAAAVPTTKTS